MIKKLLLVSISLTALNACTSTPINNVAATPLPQITFEQLNAIPVNVSKINVSSETIRGANAWDIANTMATSPDTAMRRYLAQRFKSNTQHGILNIHLSKASVSQQAAPNENKLLSYLPLANNEDYTFEIIVDLTSRYLSGQPDNSTQTRFIRKVRMPLKVTAAYRDARLQRTLEELISDIDEGLTLVLANQFNLISKKNIPYKAIPTKTELPETQTIFQQTAKEISETVRDTRTAISEQIKETMTTEEKPVQKVTVKADPNGVGEPTIITPGKK